MEHTQNSDVGIFVLLMSRNFFGFSNNPRSKRLKQWHFDSVLSHAGINMICMPHLDSNISDSAKFGGINSLFSRFLRLYSSKGFFIVQMISLISALRRKFTLHRNELEVCLSKEEFISQLCNSFLTSIVSMEKFFICMKCFACVVEHCRHAGYSYSFAFANIDPQQM